MTYIRKQIANNFYERKMGDFSSQGINYLDNIPDTFTQSGKSAVGNIIIELFENEDEEIIAKFFFETEFLITLHFDCIRSMQWVIYLGMRYYTIFNILNEEFCFDILNDIRKSLLY